MQTWTIKIELKVADAWIEDGFNASERLEEIQDKISEIMPWAYGNEFRVKASILSKPSIEKIKKLQGYES